MSTIKVDTIQTRTGSGNITASNTIAGNLTGNVTGNVTGNLTGNSTVGGTLGVTGLITASAGVAIGGTGAANTLDDYEEGTWTPNLIGSTTNPSSAVTGSGTYTKIGRLIYAKYFVSNADVAGAAGGIRLNGLPTTHDGGHVSGDVMMYYRKTANADAVNVSPYLASDTIYFYQTRDGNGETWSEILFNTSGASTGFYLWGSIIYETAT